MELSNVFHSGVDHHFGTPLYAAQIDGEVLESIQSELTVAYDDLYSKDVFRHNSKSSSHKLSDTEFASNFIEEYDTLAFKRVIDYHLKYYFSDLGLDFGKGKRPFNYSITNSWVALNEPKSYAVVHSHGDADISGVYYLKTNGKDGNIFFETPTKTMKNSYCFRNYHKAIEVVPEEGLLLLFPGWLEHGVATNETTSDRVSISFNINFKTA